MAFSKPTIDQQITTLLDIDQAAKVLAVHPATLYRWARSNRVPVIIQQTDWRQAARRRSSRC